MDEREDPREQDRTPEPPKVPTRPVDADVIVARLRGLLIETKRDARVRLEAAAKKRDRTSISSST
jgi:hypothetical protein